MGKRGPPTDPALTAARKTGKPRYWPSKRKPCKRGHIAERLVSNGKCCECLRLAHPWPGKVFRRGVFVA
jgi:hypothetical protein